MKSQSAVSDRGAAYAKALRREGAWQIKGVERKPISVLN